MTKNFVEELRWRGMLHDNMPGTEDILEKEMTSGYVGIDPTADSLHIGHLVGVMILCHMQQCGHRPVVLIGGATIAVFLIEKRLGMPVELARTLAVNTLVCSQIFYLFNSRFLLASSLSFSRLFTNHVVWIAVGTLAVLQLIFVYAPFMQRLFGSAALEVRHWLVPLGIGLAIFLIVEAEKAIFRHFGAAETPLEPSSEDDAEAERRLSRRAYGLWEEAGRPDGREREFWSQAETELAAELKSGAAGKI
jgi:hypothetical protein